MTGKEKLIFTEDAIYTDPTVRDGEFIMHAGEKEMMDRFAEVATLNGGDILEFGFGMHLSADAVQRNPSVNSHTIIEIHPEIYERAIEWAKDKPNTKILLGNWVDILPSINRKFDGILNDTHLDNNMDVFLESIKPLCKKNCIVTHFHLSRPDQRFDSATFKIEKFDLLPEWIKKTWWCNRETEEIEIFYTRFNGYNFNHKENTEKTLI